MLAANPCPPAFQQGSVDHDEDRNGNTEILPTLDEIDGRIPYTSNISSAAGTHTFHTLRKISQCQHCESYVILHGARCKKCGISCHEKCLRSLKFRCSHNAVASDNALTAHVIKCCVEELDERGLHVKGIYRLAGVKSRVQSLYQQFKSNEGKVNLDNHPPVDIADVLKLHLRELPEPLFPYNLYQDFISVAKEHSDHPKEMVERLKALIAQLPVTNFTTCAILMHHLLRVSEARDDNEMTAYNLGTVFAPTLLRPSDGDVDINAFMHIPLQRRVVEVLINNATEIFGPEVKSQRKDISGDAVDGYSPFENNDLNPVGAKWYVQVPTNNVVDGLTSNEDFQPSHQVMTPWASDRDMEVTMNTSDYWLAYFIPNQLLLLAGFV